MNEEEIIRYNNSTDNRERGKIYLETIEPGLREVVEKTLRLPYYKKFKISNREELIVDCISYLVTRLPQYKNTGHSASSYFYCILSSYLLNNCFRDQWGKLPKIIYKENL